MAASPDEDVALVDELGVVVGRAPRAEMRGRNLRHASTAVFLRHPDGRIYVHRRSPDKDWQPSAYDAAAGGVLQDGEEPKEAATRELEEELGITGVPLRSLGVGRYEDETVRCVAHAFEVVYDGPVTHSDGEVVWGGWLTLEELADRLADRGWPFVPDTRALLERLAADGVGDYRGVVR